MRVTAGMLNGHRIGHGGVVFLLAEPPSRWPATPTARPPSRPAVRSAFSVRCARDDLLTAYATERVRYGRSGIYDVTVTRGDEGGCRVPGTQSHPRPVLRRPTGTAGGLTVARWETGCTRPSAVHAPHATARGGRRSARVDQLRR